ncbi:MAG: SUMF1/EgtB/PvdO family nonheme iron enzyme [Polyangiaceae bacterium]
MSRNAMGGISMFARSGLFAALAGFALVSFSVACSKDNPSGGSGARPPTPDEIPEAVSVPADQVTSGLATDSVRAIESLSAFRITKSPITVRRYRSCMSAGACTEPDLQTFECTQKVSSAGLSVSTYSSTVNDDVPLTCATVKQATSYCGWLGAQLPNSEEWLYAARGKSPQRYAWGSSAPSCAQHPLAISPTTHRACCEDNGGCDLTQLTIGKFTSGDSPTGVEDVLLTRAELLRGDATSHFSVCANAQFGCVASGMGSGALDSFSAPIVGSGDDHPSTPTYGFRCVWEGS